MRASIQRRSGPILEIPLSIREFKLFMSGPGYAAPVCRCCVSPQQPGTAGNPRLGHAWTVIRLGFRVQVWVLALVTIDPTWELKCSPWVPIAVTTSCPAGFSAVCGYNDEPFMYTALSGKSLEIACGFPACRSSFAT
jgi:hypothetical protein